MANINKVIIRMYRLGTGDCFALKFYAGNTVKFRMMIDAGVCFPAPARTKMTPIFNNLLSFLNNKVDVLVITHEHYDHVSGFERCKSLFKEKLDIGRIWMAWTENDDDDELEEWKTDYKDWKNALALASYYLEDAKTTPEFQQQFEGNKFGVQMLNARQNNIGAIRSFVDTNVDRPEKAIDKTDEDREEFVPLEPAELNQFAARGDIMNSLKGMRIIKNELADHNISYFSPGEIFKLDGAPGLKFYILGPPKNFDRIWEMESTEEGETYEHSNNMESHRAFVNAIKQRNLARRSYSVLPFDESYLLSQDDSERGHLIDDYKDNNTWRKIDFDWLYSTGNLALRLEDLVNNLSLVIAIEIESTNDILLFTGDAEYGSWKSWHEIEWDQAPKDDKKHLTEELLNRTRFYKVAHHMSHNGTAKRKGLEMMNHPKLSAMATVDYDKISSKWKNTMPNKSILDELLTKTKGRVFVMNEKDIKYDKQTTLTEKIKSVQDRMTTSEKSELTNCFKSEKHYLEWTIKV